MKSIQETIRELFPAFEPLLADALAASGEIRSFSQGELIMKTGQNIRFTMLVVRGLIKVFREDEEGNEFLMYYLQPGQACAISLICANKQETSQVMAKAVTDTEVIAIPLQLMDQWMNDYKSWYHFVLSTYRNRFEELLETIDHIAFRNMDERLVFYLKKYQQTLHTSIVTTPFTVIAQELNSSREVISRLMKKLSEKGLIRLDKQHIEIINLDKALA